MAMTLKTIPKFYSSGVVAEVLGSHLKTLRYIDNFDGADTCELVLDDAEHRFLTSSSIPARGAEIRVELTQDKARFNCGTFTIDEIGYKSPPSELILKMTSVPKSAQVKDEKKDRSWEQTKLSRIARDIADGAGLRLFYDTNDIEIKRAEQSGSSDLNFLKMLCVNNGLTLKVHDGKLIIFDALKYESKAAQGVLRYGDTKLLSFDLKATTNDIYSDAQVSFRSNNIAEWLFSFFGGQDLFQASYKSGGGSGTLAINERVNSVAEAEKLAKSRLREKNSKEFELSVNLQGDFSYVAGNNLQLYNFGIFSGKYMIKRASHNLSGGYKTALTLQKCLSY